MDVPTALSGIETLNVDERIALVQAIWDSIAAEQTPPELTDAQKG